VQRQCPLLRVKRTSGFALHRSAAAKALGITVPQSVQNRADEVIE
jgi:hypothetical protein